MTLQAPAPQVEIGYAQAVNYNWWLYENETTPELIWPQSTFVFDTMRRTDSQVTSVLRAMTLPVRRTPWRIDPNGARPEVVQFVADDLGLPIVGQKAPKPPPRSKDRFSWPDHLRQALLMLSYGHMYFEQVYRVDEDGKAAHLRKLAPRMPKTIERIDVASDGGLISIKQYWSSTNSSENTIPVNRLVAYIHEREGGNWLGTSILRPAYKNWLLKDRLLRVQAQTIERNGMGIPLYKAPEGATEMTTGLAMAKAWRAGDAAGSAVPFGADLILRGVEGTLPDAEPAVRYHDEQIGRAVLAHFLNLGTQTGSWALGTTFADFFTLSLQTLADQVADTATQHIVEDLVDINFGDDEPAPRIVCDEIGSRQAATAEALAALIDSGVIRPDEVLEESSRQQYGLPPADPKTTRTPPAPGGGQPPIPTDGSPTPGDIAAPAAGATPDTTVPDASAAVAAMQGVAAAAKPDDDDPPPPAGPAPEDPVPPTPPLLGEDIDEQADAITAALDEWVDSQLPADVEAKFNPDELRIPGGKGGGRWTKNPIGQAISDALDAWGKGKGPDDPFTFDGKPIDREPLRRAAVARGITLKRGASRDDIVHALLGGVRDEVKTQRAERQKRLGSSKFSIDVGGKVDPEAARQVEVENHIRAAYADLLAERPANGNRLVNLADLRDRLGEENIRGADVDMALKRMIAEPGVNLIPESNQSDLTPRLRSASARIGGQDKHHITIADPSPRPMPTPVGGKRIDVAVYTGTDPNAPSLREISSANRPGRVITSQPDLAGLEKWANDHGHTDVAQWAAGERARKEAKSAPKPAKAAKKAAPRATTPEPPASKPTAGAGGVAALATGLGGRDAFDHGAGNFVDEAQRDLDAGMSPSDVADRLLDRERQISESGPFDGNGRLDPQREQLAHRVNLLALKIRSSDPGTQQSDAARMAARRQFQALVGGRRDGFTYPGQVAVGTARNDFIEGRDPAEIASRLREDAGALARRTLVREDAQVNVETGDSAELNGLRDADVAKLRRLADAIEQAGPRSDGRSKAPAKKAASKAAKAAPSAPAKRLTAADRAQAATVASAFHEDWRKTRLQPDGSYEPRVKTTKDQAWIAAHGTDQVDIANSTYDQLPEDWKAENKAAAEVVQGILKQHGGTVDLGDEKTRLAVGEEVHQAWLSRNDWAKGGELDVPFADLPRSEQDKDTDQLKVAMGALGPKKAATKRVPKAAKVELGPGASLEGRTTAQLREIAKAEGIPLPKTANRPELAAIIANMRSRQGGPVGSARLIAQDLAKTDVPGSLASPDAAGTVPLGSADAAVASLLAGHSTDQLREIAAREGIPLPKTGSRRHLAEIISNMRSRKERGAGSLAPSTPRPDGRAGGARPKGEGGAAASGPAADSLTRYAARQAQLRQVRPGETVRTLRGGKTGKVELRTARDGTRTIRKTYPEQTQQGPGTRIADAEELGALVMDAVGVRAPVVARTGDRSVTEDYIEGKPGSKLGATFEDVPAQYRDSEEGRLLGLADVLMGNGDREPANWYVTDDGHLAGIDHGGAFRGNEFSGGTSGFARYLVGDLNQHGAATSWRSTIDLDPAMLAELRQRLEGLRPEFDRVGRQDWYAQMLGRLSEIEHRAVAPAPTAIRSSAPGPHRYRHGWIPVNPLADMSDDELLDHFHNLSQTDTVDEDALRAVDAELERREGQPFDSPESRRVDELVARGHGYLDAYAEVHGLDVSKLELEQRMQRVDQERRPGESRAQTIRRMHAEHVALAVLQAEDDTRGNLLNREGRAKGIDPATLWSGSAARARKYASDELKQWWSEHGGRMTAAEYAAQFTGDTKAAEAARLAGQGKDFGV